MSKVIGITEKIKGGWLDAVLSQLAHSTQPTHLRAFLNEHLKDSLASQETRKKTAGILCRIWINIPAEREPLRARALALAPKLSVDERLWLHWGMTALAYPFFRDTVEVVGRLLTLQDDFTTAQVQARLVPNWGDRVTSHKGARYLLNTLVDWDVLRPTKKQGHFLIARKRTTGHTGLQLWLLEAILGASTATEIDAQQLLRLPELFPFVMTVGVADLRKYEQFNLHRQGLDTDLVTLRTVKLEPCPKPASTARTKQANPVITGQHELSKKVGQPVLEPGDHPVGMASPFAHLVLECDQLFRAGHFYGCIALSYMVLESMVRHLALSQLKNALKTEPTFENLLQALYKKKILTSDQKTKLQEMRADHNVFQQLGSAIEAHNRQGLAVLALNKLELVRTLDGAFAVKVDD